MTSTFAFRTWWPVPSSHKAWLTDLWPRVDNLQLSPQNTKSAISLAVTVSNGFFHQAIIRHQLPKRNPAAWKLDLGRFPVNGMRFA